MADLVSVEEGLPVRISGVSSTSGIPDNFADVTSLGQLLVIDASDGPVTPGTAAGSASLSAGQYNSSGITLTTGQQSALQLNSLGYLLIAPPLLVTPATQNITVEDTASTTTVVANGQNFITGTPTTGSVASFALSNEYSVIVQVTGTWTGTLQVEMSMDGGTTWSPNTVTQDGTNYTLNAFTNNFTGRANTVGYTNYRLRAMTAVTGTAIVRVTEAVGQSTIYINNAIKLVDNAGDVAVISSSGSLHVLSNSAGPVTPGTVATNSDLVGGQYNTTLPTLTNTEQSAIQLDSSGRILVSQPTASALNAQVVGAVPSGVANSGNPVKVGHVYNSTLPAVTSGDIVDTQANQFGERTVQFRNKYKNITASGTTTVKSGSGRLHGISFSQNSGITVIVYDNTAASGTVIAQFESQNMIFVGPLGCEFTTGLTINQSGANNITVYYY
jgi:hypothetical protein